VRDVVRACGPTPGGRDDWRSFDAGRGQDVGTERLRCGHGRDAAGPQGPGGDGRWRL